MQSSIDLQMTSSSYQNTCQKLHYLVARQRELCGLDRNILQVGRSHLRLPGPLEGPLTAAARAYRELPIDDFCVHLPGLVRPSTLS